MSLTFLPRALILVLSVMGGCASVGADTLTGRVVSVADGDTITLLIAGKEQVRVRLANIDAPEKAQPWGKRAKRALSDLVYGKQVRVEWTKKDDYGRVVGRVLVGRGFDAGEALVRDGHAWVYVKYNSNPDLPGIEARARARRKGLWALPASQRIPPWEWRHRPRTPSPEAADVLKRARHDGRRYSCGGKRYCRQMTTCAEAVYYLDHCGASTLDGNHDGLPCNKLCR